MANPTNDKDFEAHRQTYDGFLKFLKWNIIALVVVVLALYFLINP